jgi:hypothetical protein
VKSSERGERKQQEEITHLVFCRDMRQRKELRKTGKLVIETIHYSKCSQLPPQITNHKSQSSKKVKSEISFTRNKGEKERRRHSSPRLGRKSKLQSFFYVQKSLR